jgi:hypothetical protein
MRSHCLGKGLYRLNSQTGQALMLTPKLILPTDRQLWAHLLCRDCEQRFSSKGEDAAMRLVQKKDSFPLLDQLRLSWPEEKDGPVEVYSGRLAGIETGKLAYYALSVMWRSAVRRWNTLKGQTTGMSLGTYEEPIRAYLSGEGGFPNDVAILLTVCTDFISRNIVTAPWVSHRDWTPLCLLTRGLWFRAFVHPNLPQAVRRRCCVNGPRNPILVEDCEKEILRLVAPIHESAAVAPNLQNAVAAIT